MTGCLRSNKFGKDNLVLLCYAGNYYGTPKPPHQPLDKEAEPISDMLRPGNHPSSEGKRRRNRSNVEALSPGASSESTEDLLTALAQQQHAQHNGRSFDYAEAEHSLNIAEDTTKDSQRFVVPQMKEDGGVWRNIASQVTRIHQS